MTEIVRTSSYVSGGLTDNEREQLAKHTKKWIDNAFSTEPVDFELLSNAVCDLYAAAGLQRPRVILVDSPRTMAFVGGFAAAIWALRSAKLNEYGMPKDSASRETHRVTYFVGSEARRATNTDPKFNLELVEITNSIYSEFTEPTLATVRQAISSVAQAVRESVVNPAVVAGDQATSAATKIDSFGKTYGELMSKVHETSVLTIESVISSDVNHAIRDANIRSLPMLKAVDAGLRTPVYSLTARAVELAVDLTSERPVMSAVHNECSSKEDLILLAQELAAHYGKTADFFFQCVESWWRMYQGGNMWAAYDCYLTACRDVLGLELPAYDKYEAWEACALQGSFRLMHEQFCIVCDRPSILRRDDQNRPHCENGPSHQWRDGWSLYHWHGTAIPAAWVTGSPPSPVEALYVENVEQRRAACEIVGWENILSSLTSTTIDVDDDPEIGQLVEVVLPDSGPERFLRVRCGTGRSFAIPVPPTMVTARQANAWTYGLEPSELAPEVRT